jgi:acetylornithine/succinyldiaminopimelate/putrescine aminotransferase
LVPHLEFVERLKREGVLVSNYGQRGLRMLTHYQIDDAAVEQAIQAVTRALHA